MAVPFELFKASNSALVIIDKQHGYMNAAQLAARGKTPMLDAFERLAKIDRLTIAAREAGTLVIWTQMIESVQASPDPIKKKMQLDAAQGAKLIDARPGQPDFGFYGVVQPTEHEIVLTKKSYDSFSNPILAETLDAQHKKSVVLVGGFATRCVLGTAYGANAHGFHVLVAQDAVLSPTEYAAEMPVAEKIIDGILGYHASTDQIIENWSNNTVI